MTVADHGGGSAEQAPRVLEDLAVFDGCVSCLRRVHVSAHGHWHHRLPLIVLHDVGNTQDHPGAGTPGESQRVDALVGDGVSDLAHHVRIVHHGGDNVERFYQHHAANIVQLRYTGILVNVCRRVGIYLLVLRMRIKRFEEFS